MPNSRKPKKAARKPVASQPKQTRSFTETELRSLLMRGQELREQVHKKFKDSVAVEDFEIKLRLR